ncbi:MAG: hypothetical protein HOE90_02430 [Bacteriovoracaceae bacterium]|jgi:hypothetical protein|nr:hypothetical protein [Bacteriovoracaceae bacterium]
MRTILLPIMLLTFSLQANAEISGLGSFEGKYENPKSKQKIELFETLGELVGTTSIAYVDSKGVPTGKKIEYFFSFKEVISKNLIRGKLQTFDDHYDCFLENGEAYIQKMPGKKIKIISNRVIFNVKTYYKTNQSRRTPRYCRSPYSGYRYFCGYRWHKEPRKKIGRKCIIKQRIKNVVVLDRK